MAQVVRLQETMRGLPIVGERFPDDRGRTVLLAIAPVIGLGRISGAGPGVAGAFGYDIEAAPEEDPDDP